MFLVPNHQCRSSHITACLLKTFHGFKKIVAGIWSSYFKHLPYPLHHVLGSINRKQESIWCYGKKWFHNFLATTEKACCVSLANR